MRCFLPFQVCPVLPRYLGTEKGDLQFPECKGEDPAESDRDDREPTVRDGARRVHGAGLVSLGREGKQQLPASNLQLLGGELPRRGRCL